MNTITEKKENFGLAFGISILITVVTAMLILVISQDLITLNLFNKEKPVEEFSVQKNVIKNFTEAKNIPDKAEYVAPNSKALNKLRVIMPVPIGADKLIDQSINSLNTTEENSDSESITLQQKITYLYHFQGEKNQIERINTYDLENIDDTWLITDFISEVESYK